MANYVLFHKGRILLKNLDEETPVDHKRKRRRPFSYLRERERLRRNAANIGHSPLRSLREVDEARTLWATILGGSAGFLKAAQIRVLKLIPYCPQVRRKPNPFLVKEEDAQ